GRRMLKAMIAGETDAEKLAALGHERLGCTRAELVQVLTGCVREHHRFLLEQHLRTIEQLEDSIAAFDARIEAALLPFHDVVERLNEVPGFGAIAVEPVIAEIGIDMSQFPSAGHLLSWAGFVPRLDESAGKRRAARRGSKRARHGSSLYCCNPPGAQRARRIAICRLNSCASKHAAVPRRRPSRWPRRS